MRARKLSLLIAVASVAGLSQAALAADLSMPQPSHQAMAPMAPAAPAFSWTGCYVGAEGGYAWGHTGYDLNIPPTPNSGYPFDVNGGVAGGYVGCNYQVSHLVFGIEGDGAWTGLSGNDAGKGGVIDQIDSNWQANIRGRFGVAFNQTLVYAAGGASWLDVTYSWPSYNSETVGQTLSGWTVGGGVEHAFTPQWLGRIEYRHSEYGSASFPFTTATQRTLRTTTTDTVLAGIAFKLGGP